LSVFEKIYYYKITLLNNNLFVQKNSNEI